MRNVYVVRLKDAIKIASLPHFGSQITTYLYVVASSYEAALQAVQRKHPQAEVRGIELLNYSGVPIVVGD